MHSIVDTHAHLDDVAFDGDRADMRARASDAGVAAIIVPGIDAAGWPRIRELCTKHRGMFPAYGLHPLFLAAHRPAHLAELRAWCRKEAPVAVGEIGLDFHQGDLDPQAQRYYFSAQLELAAELELPVIVHARRAVEEVILALRRVPGLRGVVHSFAGSEQQAERLYAMGFCLGIGGPVTYPRARRLRRLVAGMPIEHLLLETDAPDQPVSGHQGERNEPARVRDVLNVIAELRDQSLATVAAATTANARRLFGLPVVE